MYILLVGKATVQKTIDYVNILKVFVVSLIYYREIFILGYL